MRKNDEGFTLIELLIVIVILGILAAVVVFAVGGITDKGETSACQADFKTLEVATQAYYAQLGHYPTTVAQLQSTTPSPNPTVSLKLITSTPKYATILTPTGVPQGSLGWTAAYANVADRPADCNV